MELANNKTILLGEDDSEVRSYLEMALKCQGYSVEVAGDGEEVIALLQESVNPISAILLDIVMPRKDGLETLREIRNVQLVEAASGFIAIADECDPAAVR